LSEVRQFLSEEEEQRVVEAIQEAELNTSGEIRVHIETHHEKAAYKRAVEVFAALDMHKTAERNGVLIYLATEDHQFAILGDKGIDEKVPDDFWNHVRDIMQEHFRKGDFVSGLADGIKAGGKALAEFFPYQDDDRNELSDEISTKV
jgi:uncharacterized membrane protein